MISKESLSYLSHFGLIADMISPKSRCALLGLVWARGVLLFEIPFPSCWLVLWLTLELLKLIAADFFPTEIVLHSCLFILLALQVSYNAAFKTGL